MNQKMSQKEIEQLNKLLEKAKESLSVDGLKPEVIVTRKTHQGWEVEGTTPWVATGSVDHFKMKDGTPKCETVPIYY